MKRRSFLGAMVGAPVAAQAMPESVARSLSPNLYAGALQQATSVGSGLGGNKDWLTGEIAELRKLLASAGQNRAERIKEQMASVIRFDADLECNRAMAKCTKVRLQAERDLDRRLASEKGYLQQRLESLLGMRTT
jgi:hypothetical protein